MSKPPVYASEDRRRASEQGFPSLDIDRLMLERYGSKVGAHGRAERRVVSALCDHLAAGGWQPVTWLDSDDGPQPIADKKALMETLFNLDEGRFAFANAEGREHSIYFVRGNSPDEIVSDYSFAKNGGDNFEALMDAFDPEAVA